jgi:Zn-finger nucleic acid-binding protein
MLDAMTDQIPAYEGPAGSSPAALVCPKCHGSMRTVDRNGVHIEQCLQCRGVFLDFGELEHLTQMETRFLQQPPQPMAPGHGYGQGPDWGVRGGHQYRRRGFGSLFFSS